MKAAFKRMEDTLVPTTQAARLIPVKWLHSASVSHSSPVSPDAICRTSSPKCQCHRTGSEAGNRQ
ncbi:hypothetical protein E2C01_029187 [Portunus trituberculatus]|uniref:Uncharacterized protein n=1 Tax=Portunus trituberculatus TaxID=210409 RepID=A0A5B7ENH0_PORTR|nr:hypothetical protein [Portunus trituberculatus]